MSLKVPIVIVCHNNHEYVENMIRKIEYINPSYLEHVMIMDNDSTRTDTVSFLKRTTVTVHYNYSNQGPWVFSHLNSHIYGLLPDRFVLTDPDLELNPQMPMTFLEDLIKLSDRYPWASKIGLALDISDSERFIDTSSTTQGSNIREHESQFWVNSIQDEEYSLYQSALDTTFHLFNKNVSNFFDHGTHIRVAGNFTCKHIPWYKENPILDPYTNYILSNQCSDISTTSKRIVKMIEKDYVILQKRTETILIQADHNDQNISFWRDIFQSWENNTFHIFDKFLDKNKTFIDIGGWIGTTCIYASRKSKDVIVVEPDPAAYVDLVRNCKINGCNNVRSSRKAIFNETTSSLTIEGKNESTSTLSFSGLGHPVEAVSMYDFVVENKIDLSNVSLIKVDIEGAEEYILTDLFKIHKLYNIPLYISFHYPFFKDKNLDRFPCLTETHKNIIRNIPFPAIVFDTSNRVHHAPY